MTGVVKRKPWRFNQVGAVANLLISCLFVILALATLLPLAFVIIISFSSEASIVEKGYSFMPSGWSLDAYDYLLDTGNYIGRSFLNSIGITIVGTLLGLILISTLGYSISRRTFRLRGFYTAFIFIPMLFSGGLVATYMVNTQVYGLKNTYLALILPGACSTWYAIIMRTFFQTTIPDSIIESGKIDGASQLRIFTGLVLPISLPVIATIGLFLTFSYWNAWYGAMIYLDSQHRELFPLQYVLVSIQKSVAFMARNEEYFTSDIVKTIPAETTRMAIVTVVVLPIACSYPFFQRYFVGGLTIGAVKG
ncbi:MAG: carbohydrate ABC transporter permease [Oscillospiraceae bacterium]|jgi:putative aldouronate transport system permease protein|nr:carbohydrate ABC transporter permease [Oscillospiraceae bacterium]